MKKILNGLYVKLLFPEFDAKPKVYIPLIYPQWIIKNGHANNCFWGFLQQENTIFSKNLYIKAGGINPKFKMAGDYDLWKRFAKFEKLVSLNIKFACHRKSENQLTVIKNIIRKLEKNNVLSIFFILQIYFVINLLSIS